MKTLIFLLLLSNQLVYSDSSNDFSDDDKAKPSMTVEQLRERFELRGSIFYMSSDGRRLLNPGSEFRTWRFTEKGTISSNWMHQEAGKTIFAIKHDWSINKDGIIHVRIQEFDGMKGRMPHSSEVEYGKKLREEEFDLKEFAPITWMISRDSKQKLYVRLSPELLDRTDYLDPKDLPITIESGVVTDNKGNVWADDIGLSGKYVGIKTHAGQLLMSFTNFKGAQEIGYATGQKIIVSGKKIEVIVRSEQPFIATNKRMRVYGILRPENKSEHFGSVYSSAAGDEKSFLDHLR